MKFFSRFYLLFASLVSLTQAQGSNDDCITCYLGDLFKGGFEYGLDNLIPPAAARFFAPDVPSNPGASDPAQGFVETQTDPEEQRSTNNLPGATGQTDFELQIIGEPDPKCDPNVAVEKACAVATAQIVWPSPFPCGDQVLTSKILASLNQLAPPGSVRSFHNKFGTWFFTASLTPQQIQQLMEENIGIEFIAPDEDVKNDVESLSNDFGKRALPKFENQDRQSITRPWRTKKRALPDFIRVTTNAPIHLAYISTPPDYENPNDVYASFDSAGEAVNIYWIDSSFYPENDELDSYTMSQHQLMAEDIDISGNQWDNTQPDHGGCMLSIVGGERFGVLRRDTRQNGVQLSFVKVNERISSFLSGLQAIITELERRTESGDVFIHAYTVIGTSLVVKKSLPGIQNKAAELFKTLIYQFGAVIVVAAGNDRGANGRPMPVLNDVWPASFSLNPETPLIVAGAIRIYSEADFSPSDTLPILRAPLDARCQYGQVFKRIRGTSPPTAIITGLAADMLSRQKVRAKLYFDFPEREPEPERLLNRPVAAKIRDYLDQKSYDRRGSRLYSVKGVWNGLDPRNLDIASYEA
ncbi:hypothetical protein MMC31_007498 [Peltigera leucophlebia]|nr:hypothetical protein [Peltigera leucophlebia]